MFLDGRILQLVLDKDSSTHKIISPFSLLYELYTCILIRGFEEMIYVCCWNPTHVNFTFHSCKKWVNNTKQQSCTGGNARKILGVFPPETTITILSHYDLG